MPSEKGTFSAVNGPSIFLYVCVCVRACVRACVCVFVFQLYRP